MLAVIASQTANQLYRTERRFEPDPLGIVSSIEDRKSGAEPAAVDPAQLDYLLSIGDEAFVQSIIEAYLEDTGEILTAFRKSIDDGSVDDFRFHAHAFKSGAANIGANLLVELCSKLEVISEPEFRDRRFDYLAKIERQVEDIRNCLETVVAASHENLSVEKVASV